MDDMFSLSGTIPDRVVDKRTDGRTDNSHSIARITRKPSYRWQNRATQKHAKIAPIRRAYNVVADNTIHSFSCCCVRNLRNPAKFSENSNL